MNYVVTPLERIAGDRLRTTVSPALRRALVALGGAAIALGLLLGTEAMRFTRLERIGSGYASRITAIAARVHQAQAVEHDVAHLRSVNVRIASIRRSGDVGANELAAFGNALPADVWLTAVHRDGQAFAIDGGGRTLSAIASAVDALERLPSYATVRLVSLRAQGSGSAEVSYSIVLERRR
jgi:Tfp pilus assembly protein PilN